MRGHLGVCRVLFGVQARVVSSGFSSVPGATLGTLLPVAGECAPPRGLLATPRKANAAAVLRGGGVLSAGGSSGASALGVAGGCNPATGGVHPHSQTTATIPSDEKGGVAANRSTQHRDS